jgi:hypothetical protein
VRASHRARGHRESIGLSVGAARSTIEFSRTLRARSRSRARSLDRSLATNATNDRSVNDPSSYRVDVLARSSPRSLAVDSARARLTRGHRAPVPPRSNFIRWPFLDILVFTVGTVRNYLS